MKKNYFKKYLCLWLLLLLVTFPGLAQQKIFTGTINYENGKPVANATVTIKEQPGIRVFTDNEGKFSILGETGQLIEVSTRDQRYKSQRIEADQIVLMMNSNDKLIPLGYLRELRNEELTSSIGFVNADELTKSTVRNPANALYGKIPGLTVLENGGTNWFNDPDIFIRGRETFGVGGYTQILMIVDGFERPISSLSLAEIESVAVLKDGAALAMYGSRGANGVLLVTTKRGTGKGLSINVNYDRGITQAFRIPKFLDAYGYASAVNQARTNDGLTSLYSQPELDRFKSGSDPYLYPNVNWLKEGLRDFGFSDKFNISFQEQANAVRYILLLNYDNEQGLFGPVNDNEGYTTQSSSHKINFRTNIDADISKTTKLLVKLAGNLGESQRPSTDENTLFYRMYNTPSAAFPIRTYHPANRVKKNWGGTTTYAANNPVALISDRGYTVQGRRELMTDIILEQNLDKFFRGLSVEGGISFDKSFDYIDTRSRSFLYEQLTPVLDPATKAILDTVETTYGTNSTMSFSSSNTIASWRRTTVLANLKYEKDWGDNELRSVLLFQREELVRNGQNNTYRHLLAAGNLHYGKANKYFADLTLAYNGTNLLPKDRRWGFFPALSLAWKLSNEEWLSGNPGIDNLKLRASWGMSGNDLVPQNIDVSPWAGSTGYYFQASNTSYSGVAEGRLGSSPLSFETSYKSNIGIDVGLFKMLDLNIDAFYDKRKGVIVDNGGSISGVFGVLAPYSATGISTNEGIELGLNLHHTTGDLTYHLAGQLSYAKNKIINMNEVYRPYDYLKRTGRSIGQAFGLEATGFFADAADIAASPKQTFSIVSPGDIKYKDQNGDGIINDYDQIPIGFNTSVPELYYSGSVGIEYKGVGINAVLQGAANQTIYLNTSSVFWPLLSNTNISTYSENAWTPANATTATLPRLTMSQNLNNYQPNTIWYTDGSFLKLRTLELYFDFPKQLLSRLKVKEARLYVRGMNLFSIDKIKILDPEAIESTYPTVSSYNVGIQIGF